MAKIPEDNVTNKEIMDMAMNAGPSNGDAVVSVSRKVNIGNFETIDVGVSIRIPFGFTDMDDLKEVCETVVDEGFSIASEETFVRYQLIRDQIAKQ